MFISYIKKIKYILQFIKVDALNSHYSTLQTISHKWPHKSNNWISNKKMCIIRYKGKYYKLDINHSIALVRLYYTINQSDNKITDGCIHMALVQVK